MNHEPHKNAIFYTHFFFSKTDRRQDPGGTNLYKPYRYVMPQRVGFLDPFGLESGMVFKETTRAYMTNVLNCIASIPNQ